MRVNEIKKKEGKANIYIVTLVPWWIERVFGVKKQCREYRGTGNTYVFGGGYVYVDKKGVELPPDSRIGIAIDQYRRSF